MPDNENITFYGKLLSIAIDGTKHLTGEFPSWMRPIVRIPIFCLIVLLSLIVGPIGLLVKRLRKSAINPFFKLRTEIETKWYGGNAEKALQELRDIKLTIDSDIRRLFFRGVQIAPYGRFKFDDFIKVLWLLYHWEFHLGNYQEAVDVCDYILDTLTAQKSKHTQPSDYRDEWILNKARAIYAKDGASTAQAYLLKFIDPQNDRSRINKYLYEIRKHSKKSRLNLS